MDREFDGNYYDGLSSITHNVRIKIENNEFIIQNNDLNIAYSTFNIKFTTQISDGERYFFFKNGSQCHFKNSKEIEQWIKNNSIKKHANSLNLEKSVTKIFLLTVALISFLGISYKILIPGFSHILAHNIPYKYLQKIDNNVLEYFQSTNFLEETKVSPEKKASILARVNIIKENNNLPNFKLHFFSSKSLGPNAFALTSENIVITDELINICDNDEITAVLLHEIGHLKYKHSITQAIRSTFIGFFISAILGDFSSTLTSFYGAILENKYSKNFEHEADIFAAKNLQSAQLSPELLIYALKNIEKNTTQTQSEKIIFYFLEVFSTHPSLAERKEKILAALKD
ncbi:M48 family metallopeptidase [Pigmentibacter sp. JX0631]|uniref:M48 family metallopeptidase n=1 Tax=Pigmentibacter sp. JX0631 TaxID=2976982 RepID=UPI0024690812|nr:M48 family metallopeptidase [Pigmentibacter sp. JX0631]WGL59378.1 M48 family metallopeptidase [Pigmentibacter sp. JX0631]